MTEPAPAGPTCSLCGGPAIVHWRRRLTLDEIAAEQAKEQARRDEVIALADKQLPPPEFGPLPDCADYVRVVYGCLSHYVTKDAAARIHQATCTAPDPAVLPACNCTPEPAPEPEPDPEPAPLPPGW